MRTRYLVVSHALEYSDYDMSGVCRWSQESIFESYIFELDEEDAMIKHMAILSENRSDIEHDIYLIQDYSCYGQNDLEVIESEKVEEVIASLRERADDLANTLRVEKQLQKEIEKREKQKKEEEIRRERELKQLAELEAKYRNNR